jgi:cytidine deaminase
MCGERVALYNAAMAFPGKQIEALAIVVRGKRSLPRPAPPCGACLQVINEFEMRQQGIPIRIFLQADTDEIWEVPGVKHLLPQSFDKTFLE